MMKLYQFGDRSLGICEVCKSRVNTRMEYRDYTPSGWDIAVPDILVAACERCCGVVGVPHQSTPKINGFRKGRAADSESIEARVPRIIEEAVELMTASLGGEPRSVRPTILRYYLNLIANDPAVAEAVKVGATNPIVMGGSVRRLAVKMSRHRWEPAWKSARAAGISSKGQLLRGIVVLAAEDFRISIRDGQLPVTLQPSKASRDRVAMLMALAKNIL